MVHVQAARHGITSSLHVVDKLVDFLLLRLVVRGSLWLGFPEYHHMLRYRVRRVWVGVHGMRRLADELRQSERLLHHQTMIL